ncbi:MAG: peptidoglycan D,D-transpeptidase FtsI family protein [Microbacteriaceae bacterium]
MRNPVWYRRRLVLAIVMTLAILAVFVVRLVDIQIVQAKSLNAQSLGRRSVPVTTYGVRGNIVDSNGVVLAGSIMRYDVTMAPALVRDAKNAALTVDQAFAEIAAVMKTDPATYLAAYHAALQANPKSQFMYVTKGIDTAQFDALNALKIPWLVMTAHPARIYPDGAVAGNLTGFMGTDGPQAGIELMANKCLASANGTSTYERGLDGVKLPGSTVTTKQAVNGGTVRLTINSDLQWFTQQAIAQQAIALGAQSATAIVVRVKDAHLMAVADYPSVDPNNVSGTPVSNLGSLAFSTPFEPGSIMKSLTAAALLDSGTATPASQVIAPYKRYLPWGGFIKDAFYHGSTHYTLTGILRDSSNVGISLLSQQMPSSTLYDYMKKFGIGQKTAVNFNGESAAPLRPPTQWDALTKLTVSFGQGVTATAAQMASVYQTLGNGGVRLPLTLVEGCQHPDGTVTDLPPTAGTRVVSASAAQQTVQMLESVVNDSSHKTQLTIPGYNMAAKTGTAQVAAHGVYTSDRVISTIGLAPAENPQYVVAVTFSNPKINRTSDFATPIFRKIMAQVLKTFRVTPSTVPPANLPSTW